MLKKFLKYFIFAVIVAILLPVVFKKSTKVEETVSNQVVELTEPFNYGDYTTIKLLHTADQSVETLNLDEYLLGVVSAEMPASYETEALKAQAVVARTYTIYKIKHGSKHENASICDTPLCCQAWISKENRMARWADDKREEYWNKIVTAVDSTKGKVILYQNEPINAFFHSNSGGKTESPEYVWGGNLPYLVSVETSGEEAYTSYQSEVKLSKDELIAKMFQKYSDFNIDFNAKDAILIKEYTSADRVKTIKIGNKEISGVEARSILGLKSAKFTVEIVGDEITFKVIGYGHGVGLSQSGSDSLAKQGKNYIEIIKHYYKDVEISE